MEKSTIAFLSRYSHLSERTYRRHFEQGLGLECLDQRLIEQVRGSHREQIAVVDGTFLEMVATPTGWIGFITAKRIALNGVRSVLW